MYYVNFLAVLISAIVSMIIGSIWYGPLFGKAFMQATGLSKLSKKEQELMKKKMLASYALQFIASIVMFSVFALLIGINNLTILGGIHMALLAWIGFAVPLKLGEALWGGNMTVFWIGIGNMLLTLLAGGIIIGAMA